MNKKWKIIKAYTSFYSELKNRGKKIEQKHQQLEVITEIKWYNEPFESSKKENSFNR